MTSIVVKESENGGECIKLPLKNNRLPRITVHEAFPTSGALFYRLNGELNAVGLLDFDDVLKVPFFEEPEGGWSGKEFFVKKASRPSTPMEDSPIPCKKAKISVENKLCAKDMDWFTSLHPFALYYEGDDKAKRCVTPISTQIAATYAHGSHKNLTVESTKENPIFIRNYFDSDYRIPAKVVMRNDGADFVILQAVSTEFFSKRLNIDVPEVGMRYLMLGLSNIENVENNLSLGCGSVTAKFDDELRYVGSSGSANGDSGAGVWNTDGTLIGMNIAVKHNPVKLSEKSQRQYTHAIGGSCVFVAASVIKICASEYIPRPPPIAFEE